MSDPKKDFDGGSDEESTESTETSESSSETSESSSEETFVCVKCDASFDTERKLKTHYKRNKCIGVLYVCKRCFEYFDTPSSLASHQARTSKICSAFDDENLSRYDVKYKIKYSKRLKTRPKRRDTLFNRIMKVLTQVTGPDDPIRIPLIIKMLSLYPPRGIEEVLMYIYKSETDPTIQVKFASTVHSGVNYANETVKEVLTRFIRYKKTPSFHKIEEREADEEDWLVIPEVEEQKPS